MANQTYYLDQNQAQNWTKQNWADYMNGIAKPMWRGPAANKPYRAPATIYPNGMLKRDWLQCIQDHIEADTPEEDLDWVEFSCDVTYWKNLKCDIR